jgi:protein-disulfide isomerase
MDSLALSLPSLLQPFLGAGGGDATPILGGIAAGWLVCIGLLAWKRYAGLAASGAMGLGVSIYLGFQHAADAGASVCSVSDIFNCDTVNRSEYSEFMGVPIAFIGAGFYAAVVAGSVAASRMPDQHKRAAHAIFLGSLLSVAYSGFLAWASMQLGAWCLFCISLYGVNLILLVGSALQARSLEGETLFGGIAPALMGKDDKSITQMLMVGVIAMVGSVFAYNRAGGGAPSAAESIADKAPEDINPKDLAKLFQAPKAPLDVDGTEPVLGSPSAPYIVVEFADYECPHCAATAPELKALVEAHPEIQLQFKHYPISNICNDAIGATGHENACAAAAAAECARQQGKFWEMSSLMFKNQQYLAKDDLRFMSGQIALDSTAFEACMADPATEQAVRVDAAAGDRAGLTGTPTLYLKGVKGEEWVHVQGLGDEVAALVAAHKMGIELPPTPAYAPPRR